MRIKTKLFLGLGFLVVLIGVLTVVTAVSINKLASDTKNILADNYNSVAYAREMLLALDEGVHKEETLIKFSKSLDKQLLNVTETGEKEVTRKLNTDFEKIKTNPYDSALHKGIRNDLITIMQLNMEAIQRKSHVAEKTSDKVISWISIVGTISFLIAFVLLFNIPESIANPINELTLSIKNIAAKDYSQRVFFERKDEFGDMAMAFNTMAEKLQEYNNSSLAKIITEKKRIETLIDNIHEPVIGLDENKRILFMNDEALKITNTKRENILGKLIQDIAVSNDLIRMLIKDFFEKPVSNEPLKIYADNKESFFQKEIIPIKIVPTGEKTEKHIGDVIFLKNITFYKELDFAKTNFIATVSHELKTPISAIKLSTQLLENTKIGNLNPEQKQLIDSIKDDAGRLLKITSELLNITQLESGKLQLNITITDVSTLIQKAIIINQASATDKNIQIYTHIHTNLPLIKADVDKTIWILSNLISNAIRYSHENSEISIKAEQKKNEVLISVSDTGQGIAPQYMHKIFDRYFRIPGTKKEGTGLGLSISKELLRAQKGDIKVQSELGVGSTFTISLNIV